MTDLRYTLRALARTPVFTIVAIFVLALGLGVNTAIFSLINAVMFRPLDVPDPDELRFIYTKDPRYPWLTYRDLLNEPRTAEIFRELTAIGGTQAKLGAGGEIELVRGEAVLANYFDVLGVRPALGRGFRADEDEVPGATQVALISDRVWERWFERDPNVLGRRINLPRPNIALADQRTSYVIVGVMPPEFRGVSSAWERTEFWVPLVQRPLDYTPDRPSSDPIGGVGVLPIGRLKPGVHERTAEAFVEAWGRQLQQGKFKRTPDWGLILRDSRRVQLPYDLAGRAVPSRLAMALFLVAAIVLLISAINLTGLLMARGVSRRGEIAIRVTLGASRWRVARQLLSESLLLSAAGGVAGLLFARVLITAFVDHTPAQLGRFQAATFSLEVPLDGNVLVFTAVACLLAGVFVGLAPARQASKVHLSQALSSGGGPAPRHARARLRYAVLIPQICLSLALLLIAGVLVRPLLKAELVPSGYEPEKIVQIDFDLTPMRHREREDPQLRLAWLERRTLFYRRLLDRVTTLPDVSAASLAMGLPAQPMSTWVIAREDFPNKDKPRWVSYARVSQKHFDVLGVRLTRGRLFDERDRVGSPRVVVICETMAAWLWPGENPVGRSLSFHWPDSTYPPQWAEVVGVVNEVRPPINHGGGTPSVYTPLFQDTNPYAMALIARGYGEPGEMLRRLRAAVLEGDISTELRGSRTMNEVIAGMLYPRRVAAAILALSGGVSLVLASIGLYGVISYSVAQRMREIGIRAALGAQRRDLIRLVVREAMTVAAIGAGLGFVLAYVALKVTSSKVVALPNLDPATVVVVPLILAAVILAACYLPARRAAGVDPLVVLRQ